MKMNSFIMIKFNRLNKEYQLKKKIKMLWNSIADFENHEVKNDSTNPILANARQSARMEAYTNLQDKLLDDQSQEPCFHCETIAEDENSTILPAEFEINGMKLCAKHYAEYIELKEDELR